MARTRAYYERNTRLFTALALGREARAIHRAVWADGARSYADALGFVNRRVIAAVDSVAGGSRPGAVWVLDLGCGVGGTLLALAAARPAAVRGVGVSISGSQVRLARRYAARRGLGAYCTFVEADFLDLPLRRSFDVALAVESLIHAPDPGRALAQAASALVPGGLLLVCDDFLRHGGPAAGEDRRALEVFRRGWHAAGLADVPSTVRAAERAGLRLVQHQDLTPHLRLLRLPGALAGPLLRAGGSLRDGWLFAQSLAGGLALQHCLARGVVGYHWLAFELRAGSAL